MLTTVVGSYPKPDYLRIPDYFTDGTPADFNDFQRAADKEELEKQITLAIREVIQEQIDIGIDVITDGEIRRENFVYHFCRQLDGFSFDQLEKVTYGNGASTEYFPTVVSEVKPRDDRPIVLDHWKASQALTEHPVKITIPGPMTIIGTTKRKLHASLSARSLYLPIISPVGFFHVYRAFHVLSFFYAFFASSLSFSFFSLLSLI
ncbi:5-methyltetrahydropteroyltriglutamate--homocysteine methyltransferase-like [Branchiostoma lanceolatum]|uniref:5-methyltetrahydropteroyltriglutamate-- homocysteine methyltransferase-like n=1 Tax=Branchiostoma lanceolatum TaxID=7740 RepID=UPI003455E5C7